MRINDNVKAVIVAARLYFKLAQIGTGGIRFLFEIAFNACNPVLLCGRRLAVRPLLARRVELDTVAIIAAEAVAFRLCRKFVVVFHDNGVIPALAQVGRASASDVANVAAGTGVIVADLE